MSMLLRAISPPSAEDQALSPVQDEPVTPCELELASEAFRPSIEDCSQGTLSDSGETLIADTRADLSPAQMVERKLLVLLRDKAFPVSHMQMAKMLRSRS